MATSKKLLFAVVLMVLCYPLYGQQQMDLTAEETSIERLQSSSTSLEERISIAKDLGNITNKENKRVIQALIAVLKDKNNPQNVRYVALTSLVCLCAFKEIGIYIQEIDLKEVYQDLGALFGSLIFQVIFEAKNKSSDLYNIISEENVTSVKRKLLHLLFNVYEQNSDAGDGNLFFIRLAKRWIPM